MVKFTFKEYLKNNPQFLVAIIVTGIMLIGTIIYSWSYIKGEDLNSWTTSMEETIMTGWFMIMFSSLIFVSAIALMIQNFNKTKKRVEKILNK